MRSGVKINNKFAVVVSSLAVVISAISMFVGDFDASQITVFCCTLAVLFSNLAGYATKNEKEGNGKTDGEDASGE